jgi:hypothetical protein
MIPFLLKLLEARLEKVDKPNAVKAQICDAIKAMRNSAQHFAQVLESH